MERAASVAWPVEYSHDVFQQKFVQCAGASVGGSDAENWTHTTAADGTVPVYV